MKQMKMCLKEFTLRKSYKIFPDHQVWSKQNKHIAGNIHSTQKREKQTAKHDWTKFVLKLCLLKLKKCSSTYDIYFLAYSILGS